MKIFSLKNKLAFSKSMLGMKSRSDADFSICSMLIIISIKL